MRAQQVIEGTLAFRFPHHAVEIVVPKPIFDQRGKKIAGIRIVQANCAADPAVHVHFRDLFESVHEPRIVGFLEQAVRPHAPRLRLRNDVSEDVEIAQFRGANILNYRLGLEIGVQCGVTSAVDLVVLLRAMIGQR